MSVFPGFGGQSFIPSVLENIRFLEQERRQRGLNYRLEVDGGINVETGLLCRQAGADTLVAGTAFYKAANRQDFIKKLSA
jgi:ribulose-phosphate 3-epimerase